jgi:acid phosphatase type 7
MTIGATPLLFLDSGEDKPDGCEEYSGLVEFQPYLDEQIRWLEREIAAAAAWCHARTQTDELT